VDATTNRTTTLTYTTAGKPETITDPRGKTTTLAYSTAGDLTSVTDPLTHATTFGYDSLGRRTTVTDALNNTTTTAYDARGRVTRITSPDTTHTDFAYDLAGRRTSVTDPLGRTTYYAYDPYGRLSSVVDPMNGTTAYGYDLMSNLTSLTDAKGQTTSFEYDGYNRVKKVIYPGGAYETFTYDAGGRLATRVDRKNVTTTYAYDGLNRLTGKTYSDGTTPAVVYTYTTAGQLATAANGTDTLTWTYDLSGQLTSEQSTKNSSTVAYTYDLGGNRLSLSLDGQVFVTYAYDDASRLTTITRGSSSFTFGYDNANRRTSLGYPNGVNTTYSYDSLSRLTNLTAAVGQTTITSSIYTYDAAGNRLSKTHPDYAESYVYDALYRLKEVNRTGLTKHWIYSYDAVGNRLSEQVDNSVSTYAYNEKNQLLSTTGGGLLRFRGTLNEPGTVTVAGQPAQMLAGNTFEAYVDVPTTPTTVPVVATDTSGNATTKNYQVTGAGSAATYSYDLNGNLVQKVEGSDTWTYEWNAENQLKRVLKNAVEQARFSYDPLKRRVERVAAGSTTLWLYDGEDISRETVGGTATKFVHGPNTDEPLAQEDGAGALSHIHADGLGSVVRTTNAAGAAIYSRRYDAFGNLEIGAISGHAFTGREWDAAAGLAYYRARYYDPSTGRFQSEDPIRWIGGMNLFEYAASRPTTLRDPKGLQGVPNVWMAWKLTSMWTCAESAEAKGHAAGRDVGYRYGHCIAACEATKCGLNKPIVTTLGFANELRQTWQFFTNPDDDGHSAFGKPDLRDNDIGASCPPSRSCPDQCSPFTVPGATSKTEGEFGPLFHLFKWVLVPTAQ
jgi:RHS repeat-associated protein